MQKTKSASVMVLAMCTIACSSMGQEVILLTPLEGNEAKAYDINEFREIVGQSVNGQGEVQGVRWDASGSVTALPQLPGFHWATAEAINNNGEIVGYSENDDGIASATYWGPRGGVVNVHTAIGADGASVAWDINDAGLIVGQASLSGSGLPKGFIWDQVNPAQAEGTLPFYMGGANFGVNNHGELVGNAFFFGDPDNATYAVPDGNGGYTYPGITPPGFNFSQARAISDSGTIVGFSNYITTSSGWNACIFTGDMEDPVHTLGTLPGLPNSEAMDVNEDGLIVGYAWDISFEGTISHAWAYVDGQMHDLNDLLTPESPFAELTQALGVNNRGDIVGFGVLKRGRIAAFLIKEFATGDACPADMNGDGTLDFGDVSAFIGAYQAQSSSADFDDNGVLDFFDVSAFLGAYHAGCP